MRVVLGLVVLCVGACGSVPSGEGDAGGGTPDGAVGVDGERSGVDAVGVDGPDLSPPRPSTELHHLFPLDLGREWTWQVNHDPTFVALSDECADGTFVQRTLGVVPGPDGVAATMIESFCGTEPTLYTYRPDAVAFSVDGAAWSSFLREPLRDGSAWDLDGVTAHWNGPNPINIAAGTFDACWTAVVGGDPEGGSVYTSRQVYCPDVGPVYLEVTENNSDAAVLNAQLTSYTRR